MFKKAIVRTPCNNMINGLTTSKNGPPEYDQAVNQHKKYIMALEQCGLEVIKMKADERYPDSTFVEDTAILTSKCAIITNPGAPSRRGEIIRIKEIVKKYFSFVETVENPGTIDGGDVMLVDDHFYIGLSDRTNKTGAEQAIEILNKYGMTGSTVNLEHVLHLKTGVSYLENNCLLASGEFIDKPEFKSFKILEIEPDESYAANSLWINGKVLVPEGYPKATKTIEDAGFTTIEVDVSEFRKLDGGLSCLSLRF